MEVILLDASVFDRHFLIHQRAQAHDGTALNLRGDLVRVDGMTAVDAEHHAVNLDLA